jgi:hypothetical protein
MIKQQPADVEPADDVNSSENETQQQLYREQEQQGAEQLWHWYCSTVLGPNLDHILPQDLSQDIKQQQRQRQQQQQQGLGQYNRGHHEPLNTVAAAALLHATAAMGWTADSIADLTGSPAAAGQLKGVCLLLYEAGLAAAFMPGTKHPTLQQMVPAIAVVNLVTAMHEVGVKVSRDHLRQLQDDALLAALHARSSRKTTTTTSSSSRRRRMGPVPGPQ